jgi:hypothetical protein
MQISSGLEFGLAQIRPDWKVSEIVVVTIRQVQQSP